MAIYNSRCTNKIKKAVSNYQASLTELIGWRTSLAQFLIALQSINSVGGPQPGSHSFYRGGSLAIYDSETRQAINTLKGKIDVVAATEVWERAFVTTWQGSPVWVHGDISARNLLVQNGHLSAVIDFGQLAVGDPACDLSIAWTMFEGKSREVFRTQLSLDSDTWARARGWTLWKALITAAGFTNPSNAESVQCWRIMDAVLFDHKQS